MTSRLPTSPHPTASQPVLGWKGLSLFALLVLLVAALAPTLRDWASLESRPVGGAAWIWSAEASQPGEAEAFYALRDFHLAHLPEQARLYVIADEEYLLTLNGFPVGAGLYAEGNAMDTYAVEGLLLPGANRLLVELRSTRGAGGLLLRLEDEVGATLVASDGTWRTTGRDRPGLAGGWFPFSELEKKVKVWGRPPLGRWGSPFAGALQTVPSWAPLALLAPREEGASAASFAAPAGAGTLYDWGRSVEGYLLLRWSGGAREPVLVFYGDEPPRPEERQADHIAHAPAGAPWWQDSQPRRFRYALVLDLGGIEAARVLPATVSEDRASPAVPEPIFGVHLPPRLPPLEARLRRRLWARN